MSGSSETAGPGWTSPVRDDLFIASPRHHICFFKPRKGGLGVVDHDLGAIPKQVTPPGLKGICLLGRSCYKQVTPTVLPERLGARRERLG